MKTIYLSFLCVFTFVNISTSQEAPKTPMTPTLKSSGDSHTNVTTTMSNTTSISNSDDFYKFTSKFHKTKNIGVRKLLLNRLEGYSLKKVRGNYIWSKRKDGLKVFECNLTNRTIKLFLNKDEVSKKVYYEIKSLSEELQQKITAHTSSRSVYGKKSSNRIQRAEENVERITRQLELAKEKLRKEKLKNN